MLFKRPGSPHWQIKFSLKGQHIRRSSGTSDKRLAERIEHAAREEILKASIEGYKPAFTWKQAIDLWQREKRSKRSLSTDIEIFKSMDKYFDGMDVKDITAAAIAAYQTDVATRASPSTSNRHIGLLNSVMRRLVELEILDKKPTIKLMAVEPKDMSWFTKEQVTSVLMNLDANLRDIAEFAVMTGLRRGNVMRLEWSWVDMDNGVINVPASSAKGKRVITIPLAKPALALLSQRFGINTKWVFDQVETGSFDWSWDKARKSANLPNLRFHDLRHVWASYHAVNGTPDRVLQRLGGWSSPKQLERYARLRLEDLVKYADNSK